MGLDFNSMKSIAKASDNNPVYQLDRDNLLEIVNVA
jgi:hypothetical protein